MDVGDSRVRKPVAQKLVKAFGQKVIQGLAKPKPTKFVTQSAVIREKLLSKGMTIVAAARQSGISLTRLKLMLKKDLHVQIATAGKVREFFGEDAVKIIDNK